MEETCSICLEEIHDQKIQVYPCSHTFHPTCLSGWRSTRPEETSKITCPNCRGVDLEANRPLLSERTLLLTGSETSSVDLQHVAAFTQFHTVIRNARIRSFCNAVCFYGTAVISGFVFAISAYLFIVLLQIWFD